MGVLIKNHSHYNLLDLPEPEQKTETVPRDCSIAAFFEDYFVDLEGFAGNFETLHQYECLLKNGWLGL